MFPLIHFTKWETKSVQVLFKYLETCLVYYGWCKTSECTWYGEPLDALPSLYFSLSDKSSHKPLFYWTSNMKRSGEVFCYKHHPLQQYPRHYLQKEGEKESNTSNNKKHSESANLCIVWRVWNSLVGHEEVQLFLFLLPCSTDHEYFAKIHSPSIMLLTNTDLEGKKYSFRNVKCNVFRLFLVWHPPNLMTSIHHVYHTVAHRHDTTPSLRTVNQSSWAWQSSQLFCCSVSNISWKCHWNPFAIFSVMLLESMDPESIKFNQDCSLSHIRPVLKISGKSIYPLFCNVANIHRFPEKN